jgi:hypothetical protein
VESSDPLQGISWQHVSVINNHGDFHMLLAFTIGRLSFELTRSDVLLRIGRKEAFWSWAEGVGPLIETVS